MVMVTLEELEYLKVTYYHVFNSLTTMLCFIWENSVLNENRLAVKMQDQSAVLFLGKILEAL